MGETVTVPLVIYTNGERHVVGSASLDEHGYVTGYIRGRYVDALPIALRAQAGEFSINPGKE